MAATATQAAAEFTRGGKRVALRVPFGLPMALLASSVSAPWPAVCYYFRRWQQDGGLQQLNRALNEADRQAQDKRPRRRCCV